MFLKGEKEKKDEMERRRKEERSEGRREAHDLFLCIPQAKNVFYIF